MKRRVLFICVHNSARSQMAEAWLNHVCGIQFEAESAGLEPGQLNPFAVTAMAEVGLDISAKDTRKAFDVFRMGKIFAFVISVCDEASGERCPIFPGINQRLRWSFPDPSAVTGSDEEKLAATRKVRDRIKEAIEIWCARECKAVEPSA